MDENSCEGETSAQGEQKKEEEAPKKAEDVEDLILAGKSESAPTRKPLDSRVDHPAADRGGSLFDTSGPSLGLTPQTFVNSESDQDTDSSRESLELTTSMLGASVQGSLTADSPSASTANVRPHVRIAEEEAMQTQPRRDSIGPPPSYSFVMKEKRRGQKSNFSMQSPLDIVTDRPPPPAYAGIRGLYTPPPLAPPENADSNRMCLLPSFAEPIWRSHSQPAFCPRCGIIVLTTTHAHESVATHVAALALCLFGCWPCCFLPYCMNVCKNTHHHCPVCQAYLGSYTPW